jgi:precorrin-2/cobalt-factor-2 C20-methyltransferase
MVAGEAMTGKLIGLGTGPGDPELLTLKAVGLLRQASHIAYIALPDTPGFARQIVAAHIAPTVSEIRIDVTMTADRKPAQQAYDIGAKRIGDVLNTAHDVICLCEGDPLFYGSFMYLAARLSKQFHVETIPGITSLSAASAMAGLPLVARDEVLTATLSDERIEGRLREADTVVLMKLGRHAARIKALAKRLGLTGVYVERATLPAGRVIPLNDAPDDAPYFSMALFVKGQDPWLSR